MKRFYIGVDISKEWLDYAVCKDLTQIPEVVRVKNTIKGIKEMIRSCRKQKEELWFCMEHTGNYGLLLAYQLQLMGLKYSMLPPVEIKRSLGLVRGKTDKIDAKRISIYAATNAYKLKSFELPGEDLLKLKSLMTYREQLVKIKTQLQNSCQSHQEAAKIVKLDNIVADIKESIKIIKQKIAKVEDEINLIIKENEQLKSTFTKVTSVKGIGLVIGAFLLVSTNNFTAFDNPRKYNCYAGLAPFEYSSGTSIRGKTRTSKLRNRTAKTLIFNGANSAAIHDKELRAYYKRKEEEGKSHKVIINNIACKLIYRAFAVANRETPYVMLSH